MEHAENDSALRGKRYMIKAKTGNGGGHGKLVLASLALALLPPLALGEESATTADTERLFKQGIFLREQAKIYSSIEALETVLSNNPTLQRARLELAVAYFRALDYARATAEAQRVLDDPKTPDNVRLAVLAFMAQIKRDEVALSAKPHNWNFSFDAGLQYDTNVNVGPSSTTLPGGLVLNPGSKPRSDWAGMTQISAIHTYNSPFVVRIGESPTRFIWQSSASLYHKGYFREDDFNLTAVTLATGPGWIAPNQWRGKVNFQVDELALGDNRLGTFYSISPTMTFLHKNGEINIEALAMHKNFVRTVDQGRDADFFSAGASYGHIFLQGKLAAQIGAKGFTENAETLRFDNKGWEAFAGANASAWEKGGVYARYTYRKAKHKGEEPVFGIARKESEQRLEIGLTHTFSEGLLKDWKFSGSWQRTDTDSNVDIYTYAREVTGFNLSRMF